MKENDTISRQAAIDALDKLCDRICEYSKKQRHTMCGACNLGSAFDVIDELPTAEPKRGTWKCEKRKLFYDNVVIDYKYIYCSECGEQRRIGWSEAKYCPNCGARMTMEDKI
jgi:hypothetical protein